jgi:hypothetical protein
MHFLSNLIVRKLLLGVINFLHQEHVYPFTCLYKLKSAVAQKQNTYVG